MSVKTWKKIISISVALILLVLVILTLFFGIGFFRYSKYVHSSTIVDLQDYGYKDAEDVENMFRYLKNVKVDETLSYQTMYDNLYIDNDFNFKPIDENKKICYLTFDDGPNSEVTPKVLDILKEYNVKATFFVIYRGGSKEKALYKRIVDEGHTIAVHTASHNYTKIYSSVEAYLEDFNKISEYIESVTGVKPEIFRFPGGSVNSYNRLIYHQLIAEMTRRGYVYYDWDYSSGDAARADVPASEIKENVLNGSTTDPQKILLCHDGPGHQNTAEALPEIIEGLLEQGYSLEALDKSVTPVCFGY